MTRHQIKSSIFDILKTLGISYTVYNIQYIERTSRSRQFSLQGSSTHLKLQKVSPMKTDYTAICTTVGNVKPSNDTQK